MSSFTMHIDMDMEEGTMVRLLGTIQRRGFALQGLSLPDGEAKRKKVTVTVTPLNAAFRVEVLARQIERLQEVHACKCAGAEKQSRNLFALFFPGRQSAVVA